MNDTFDDARALAQHSAALRRLARGLVSDPNTADDLVQDTWLGALTRWRRRGEATGPGGLRLGVRHRAISARRRRGAEALEEADSLTGSGGDPSETAATLERYRVLHEELAGLREPYRRTLVARFVEEQRHAAIAKAEGISVDTVRTRITRGLALLREQLDRRFDGDGGRGAWMAALAPLAVPEQVASSVSTGTLVAAACAIAAIGAFVAADLAGGGASEPSPEIASRAASTGGAPAAEALLEPAELAEATRDVTGPAQDARAVPHEDTEAGGDPAADEPLSISGIVVDQNGSPLEGIAFAAKKPPRSRVFDPFEAFGTTARDGAFEVTLDADARVEDEFNIAFAIVPNEEVMISGTWHVQQLEPLERVHAGTAGHVVQLDVDQRTSGTVVGTVPALDALLSDRSREATDISLERDAGQYFARTKYMVSDLTPGTRYVIEDVAPGRYTLLASGKGLRPIVRSGVVVRSGETTEVGRLSYDQLGDVVFDEVRLEGANPGEAGLDGIGGWLISEDGFVIVTYVRFGEDVPLTEYVDQLSAGDWTIQWERPGYVAPTTRLTVRAGEETRTSVVVRPTREVEVLVRPPVEGSGARAPWSEIHCTLLDESGREIRRRETLLVRRGSVADQPDLLRAMVPVPIGGRATAVLDSDAGHRAHLVLDEITLRTAASPPLVELRPDDLESR